MTTTPEAKTVTKQTMTLRQCSYDLVEKLLEKFLAEKTVEELMEALVLEQTRWTVKFTSDVRHCDVYAGLGDVVVAHVTATTHSRNGQVSSYVNGKLSACFPSSENGQEKVRSEAVELALMMVKEVTHRRLDNVRCRLQQECMKTAMHSSQEWKDLQAKLEAKKREVEAVELEMAALEARWET